MTIVNGLKLPARLVELMETGRWKRPTDVTVLAEMTGVDWPESFFFDDVAGMIRETPTKDKFLYQEGLAPLYGLISSSDPNAPSDPDLLDIDRAVFIAGNPDEDVIVLDYTQNLDEPKVICNTRNHIGLRWKVIAATFDEFADRLGL